MRRIVMTKEQSDSVCGEYLRNCKLISSPTTDGRFVLPEAVLLDIDYSEAWELLRQFPIVDEAEITLLDLGVNDETN